jgi:hypothetical protein
VRLRAGFNDLSIVSLALVELVERGREQALQRAPVRLHQQPDRVGTAIGQAGEAPQQPILRVHGGLQRLEGVAEQPSSR